MRKNAELRACRVARLETEIRSIWISREPGTRALDVTKAPALAIKLDGVMPANYSLRELAETVSTQIALHPEFRRRPETGPTTDAYRGMNAVDKLNLGNRLAAKPKAKLAETEAGE